MGLFYTLLQPFYFLGMVFVPESQSGRFLVASWWFYVLVVAGTYNGNLIAFLTAPSLRIQVDSVQALADSNMDIGFEAQSATHQMLKVSSWQFLEYKLFISIMISYSFEHFNVKCSEHHWLSWINILRYWPRHSHILSFITIDLPRNRRLN